MINRTVLQDALLSGTEWENADQTPMAGDASARSYVRLTSPTTGRTAVMMDATGDSLSSTRSFVAICRHLREIGLSAPEIYAEDTDFGMLLLEDLGDDLFARHILTHPETERQLYEAATDLLVAIRNSPIPSLHSYGPAELTEMVDVAFGEYADAITGETGASLQTQFFPRFEDVLHRALQGPKVLAHRDFHAENLIWLPERDGVQRVGLLDFQDAFLGHAAYDLVSLLQDVRRKVPAGIAMKMIERYVKATGEDDHAFRTAYAVLGAQRNLRILGVFARLGRAHSKPGYIELIPAVWAHLQRNLDHPALAPIASLLRDALPVPSPENLERLKSS